MSRIEDIKYLRERIEQAKMEIIDWENDIDDLENGE